MNIFGISCLEYERVLWIKQIQINEVLSLFILEIRIFFFGHDLFERIFFVRVFMYFCWTWHLFFIELRFISSRNLSYPSYSSSSFFLSSSSSSSSFSTSSAFSSFLTFSPVMVGLRPFPQWKEVFESFRYFWFFFSSLHFK